MNHPTKILDLVEFEKQVTDLPIKLDDKVHIDFSNDGKRIRFTVNNTSFYAILNQVIVHQLGGRIFPAEAKQFSLVRFKWDHAYKYDLNSLKQNIIYVLKTCQLIIKHYPKNGNNEVYGIVSSQFHEINQINFREQFLKELEILNGSLPESTFLVNNYGQLVEEFIPNYIPGQIKYSYCLVHGQNNGYNAIKVFWGRKIIICSNGLTKFDGEKFTLKHKKDADPMAFINYTFDEGMNNCKFLNTKISLASETRLNTNFLDDFMGGITLARATKERILNRLEIEKKDTGNNEWSLSQSLTWLSEHEKAISFYTKNVLRETGTFILEQGLEEYLKQKHITKEFNKEYITFQNN